VLGRGLALRAGLFGRATARAMVAAALDAETSRLVQRRVIG